MQLKRLAYLARKLGHAQVPLVFYTILEIRKQSKSKKITFYFSKIFLRLHEVYRSFISIPMYTKYTNVHSM